MRFRFNIRDLLWLAVVVALAVGWSIHYLHTKEKVDRLEAAEFRVRMLESQANALKQVQERLLQDVRQLQGKLYELQGDSHIERMPVVGPQFDR